MKTDWHSVAWQAFCGVIASLCVDTNTNPVQIKIFGLILKQSVHLCYHNSHPLTFLKCTDFKCDDVYYFVWTLINQMYHFTTKRVDFMQFCWTSTYTMIMMGMMSRTIKTDHFWREVSDVQKHPRGSPGGWDEGSDQYCMCHKMLPSDNPQNRTNANAMVTLKMCGCEGFLLYVRQTWWLWSWSYCCRFPADTVSQLS